jgi:CrcB protein
VTRFLLICLGGAAGTGARYLIARALPLPFGTLVVNLVGSFLMALIMYIASWTSWMTPDLRLMLTGGVMGGFTTYSAFNYETTNYFREGAWAVGFANVAGTLIGCLIAGLLGLALGKLIIGR